MTTFTKSAALIFLYMCIFALALAIMFSLIPPAHAQVSGSCWEIKSDLKKLHRIYCAAENSGPFNVSFDQNKLFRQLKTLQPVPYVLVIERATDQNRKSGNSKLDRIERHGVPLAGTLGAAGVYGGGPITAGIAAGAALIVPPLRRWFYDASKPLWTESRYLLSDQPVEMVPGASLGFWFYSEKGGVVDFRILPMEMAVVESASIRMTAPDRPIPLYHGLPPGGNPGQCVFSDESGALSWTDDCEASTSGAFAVRRMNFAEAERYMPPEDALDAARRLALEAYQQVAGFPAAPIEGGYDFAVPAIQSQ